MKYAIVGCRDYSDYVRISSVINNRFPIGTNDTIIAGCAKGVDKIARIIAWSKYFEHKTQKKFYKTFWTKYRLSAGQRTNQMIVDDCDELIAFWDGKSKGTKDILTKAMKQKKTTHIYWINSNAHKNKKGL